jgi:hypothetical protein
MTMNIAMRSAIAAAAVAMVSACASSGRGGESESTGSTINGEPVTLQQALLCILSAGFACPGNETESTGQDGSAPDELSSAALANELASRRPVAFTRWQDLELLPCNQYSCGSGYRGVTAEGPQVTAIFERGADGNALQPVSSSSTVQVATATLTYGYDGAIREFNGPGGFDTFRRTGKDSSGNDIARNWESPASSAFTDSQYRVALVANPFKMKWDYQSFGVWNHLESPVQVGIHAHSFGAATPGPAVPLTGQAIFSGKLAGMYVSPSGEGSAAVANVGISTDFSARSLSFFSNNTHVTTLASVTGLTSTTATAAPSLDLRGTLTYAPGSGTFTGSLKNNGFTMSGVSNGQFYGPAAQELGGVFALRSATTAETFVGAYGAKR